jgi:hypothetical protein
MDVFTSGVLSRATSLKETPFELTERLGAAEYGIPIRLFLPLVSVAHQRLNIPIIMPRYEFDHKMNCQIGQFTRSYTTFSPYFALF